MRDFFFLLIYVITMFAFFSCSGQSETDFNDDNKYKSLRQRMVETQIIRRNITDKNVLEAMRTVPRHLFVARRYRSEAYNDHPLPIACGQTISQPYIVAIMTELIQIDSLSKVLEIGTGSGYQAAVLGEISDSVYSIEIIPELADRAEELLDSLRYKSVHIRAGDGYKGWPEAAPFDAIMVTAAAPEIPQPLIEQLKIGGRMVIPVGEGYQDLILITKNETGVVRKSIIPVRFVPMTGEILE
ncbi:MAG: protein-L-isoaspartate O-methyltransferase [Candidatus Zixiibacteriota bacterium]|nr:MAG: protein-L-isoaspartate O-methyltransferase [candidate division Zixibacteria bacterium]